MTDEIDGDWPIVLTTETLGYKLCLPFFVSIMGVPLAVMEGLIVFGRSAKPITFEIIPVFAAAPLVVGAVALMFLLIPTRGTWIIDPHGIEYRPCHGRPRSLAWADVRRVRWNAGLSRFEGPGVSIAIPWSMVYLPKPDRVRDRVAKLLPDFDLSRRPLPSDRPRPSSPRDVVRNGLKMIGVAVAVTTVILAGLLALYWAFPLKIADTVAGWTMLAVMVVLHAPIVMIVGRHERLSRQINPPWRYRLSKSGKSS